MKYWLCGLVLLAGSAANAADYFYPEATTATESYRNGAARLLIGQGRYLESSGRAAILQEQARSLRQDNWVHGVQSQWLIQDAWRERYRIDYLTQAHQRLDRQEEIVLLRQREARLRERGILDPKPKSSIGFNGKRYPSYAALRKSKEFRYFLAIKSCNCESCNCESCNCESCNCESCNCESCNCESCNCESCNCESCNCESCNCESCNCESCNCEDSCSAD